VRSRTADGVAITVALALAGLVAAAVLVGLVVSSLPN
jgi:hypothetical protein